MLDERIINLINAELDGELSAPERAELESILEQSADARAMQAELQKLNDLLGGISEREPPANFSSRLLSQVRLPASGRSAKTRAEAGQRGSFSLIGLLTSFHPIQTGLAFAAGLLLAAGLYELASDHGIAGDTSLMVGTMAAGGMPTDAVTVDSLAIRSKGISGTVALRENGALTILDFDLDSDAPADIEISYAGTGLRFGGMVRSSDSSVEAVQSYSISGESMRVAHEGRQAFSVFLRNASDTPGGGRKINIGITSGGEERYSGILHG